MVEKAAIGKTVMGTSGMPAFERHRAKLGTATSKAAIGARGGMRNGA